MCVCVQRPTNTGTHACFASCCGGFPSSVVNPTRCAFSLCAVPVCRRRVGYPECAVHLLRPAAARPGRSSHRRYAKRACLRSLHWEQHPVVAGCLLYLLSSWFLNGCYHTGACHGTCKDRLLGNRDHWVPYRAYPTLVLLWSLQVCVLWLPQSACLHIGHWHYALMGGRQEAGWRRGLRAMAGKLVVESITSVHGGAVQALLPGSPPPAHPKPY